MSTSTPHPQLLSPKRGEGSGRQIGGKIAFHLTICLLALIASSATYAQPPNNSHARTSPVVRIVKGSKEGSETLTFARWSHQWRSGAFQIYTTVEEPLLRPLSDRLVPLKKEMEETLGISIDNQPVYLVVLSDQTEFELYLRTHFPNTPNRRALYIQNRGQGVVLTYLHSEWLIDARHECSHALLHQTGIKLPLWLDEGIAEYFENTEENPTYHPAHSPAVQTQLRYGQVVEIEELENHAYSQLDAKGYRDAWSVVALLLHHSDETRQSLRTYVSDLQSGAAAGLLIRRLSKETRANWREIYTVYYKQ